MNCTAFTYYVTLINGQMHVRLIATSVKLLPMRCCCVPIKVTQDGFSYVETYMRVHGL